MALIIQEYFELVTNMCHTRVRNKPYITSHGSSLPHPYTLEKSTGIMKLGQGSDIRWHNFNNDKLVKTLLTKQFL